MISDAQIHAIMALMNHISLADGYDEKEGHMFAILMKDSKLMDILIARHPELKTGKGAFQKYMDESIQMPYVEACETLKNAEDYIKNLAQNMLKMICKADGKTTDEERKTYNEIAKYCGWNMLDEIRIEENDKDDEDENDTDFLDSIGDVVVNNIGYSLWEDGTATASYFEDDEDCDVITVASKVSHKGKSYTVTSFEIEDGEYEKLILPSSLKIIYGAAFDMMDRDTRSRLNVEIGSNSNILCIDKVFYSNDGKILWNANLMDDCEEYTVRDGVEQIANDAFQSHDEICTLNVPTSVKQIDSPFSDVSGLMTVNIYNDNGNVKFYDEEPGVESFPVGVTINYLSAPPKTTNNENNPDQAIDVKKNTGIKGWWRRLSTTKKVIAIIAILMPFFFDFWTIILTILILWFISKKSKKNAR